MMHLHGALLLHRCTWWSADARPQGVLLCKSHLRGDEYLALSRLFYIRRIEGLAAHARLIERNKGDGLGGHGKRQAGGQMPAERGRCCRLCQQRRAGPTHTRTCQTVCCKSPCHVPRPYYGGDLVCCWPVTVGTWCAAGLLSRGTLRVCMHALGQDTCAERVQHQGAQVLCILRVQSIQEGKAASPVGPGGSTPEYKVGWIECLQNP